MPSAAAAIAKKHPTWEFPDFTDQSFFAKKQRFAICVFVINEGEKVQKQLRKMKEFAKIGDIIIADGGSTDGSLEPKFLKEVGVRALLTKKGPGKLSAQMRMAFAYTMDQGYDGVVVIDGNGKDHVDTMPTFIKLLDDGYDHVQGSRFIPGGKAINTPLERLIGVRALHAPLLSLASGFRHTDTTNGYRAYSRKLLLDEDLNIFRDVFATYELHYYLAVESARAGKYKLIETPVTREYPAKGKTPTKISPIKGNAKVLKILFKAALRQYNPPRKQTVKTRERA
jgi:glycosyltransferase involved in cell wall biosynthesis